MSFSLDPPANKTSRIIQLILFTVFTFIALAKNQVTVFYLIYIFWIDEILKTSFDGLAFLAKREKILNRSSFALDLRIRFFFLLIYFVFIIIMFGFVMNFNQEELFLKNMQVMFFQNIWFNLTILGFFFRELVEYIHQSQYEIYAYTVFSPGILILHISIVIGLLIFAFLSWSDQSLINKDNTVISIISIVPFLAMRFYVDYLRIKAVTK